MKQTIKGWVVCGTGSSCGQADSVMDSHTTDLVDTVLSTKFRTGYYHNSIIELSVRWSVESRGRISRSGLTQDIKMGNCVFQCDIPHQWIAQRQVGPVSVYCDRVVVVSSV